jgi:isopenicillin-N epimerase
MSQFSSVQNEFLVDPTIHFLNHGSFGACPKPVFDSYQRWQRELEFQPVKFLGRNADDLLYQSRSELATYLGTDPLNLVYVPNATHGINIVARSLHLQPGDVVLTTDHEYGAMDRTWRFLATQKGFEYRAIPIPTPIPEDDLFVKLFTDQFSLHVKVLYISQITSPTAAIFPVEKLIAAAHAKGILTIIDGAHVPGQIPLNLSTMGADFYSGNLHKWLCAPKGSAFLYAHPSVQHRIEPLIVSWGYESEKPSGSPFIDLLQWAGTRDLSPFLAVPDAIHFEAKHHWDEINRLCHQKAVDTEKTIRGLTGLPSIYSNSDQFGQMFALYLPEEVDVVSMKETLYDQYRVECPLYLWNQKNIIRISLQAYNSDEDVSALVSALKELL